MQPANTDLLKYSGTNSGPQPLTDVRPGTDISADEHPLFTRARDRASQSAYDLYRALRNGDISYARWLLDEVSAQVISLFTGQPPQ